MILRYRLERAAVDYSPYSIMCDQSQVMQPSVMHSHNEAKIKMKLNRNNDFEAYYMYSYFPIIKNQKI